MTHPSILHLHGSRCRLDSLEVAAEPLNQKLPAAFLGQGMTYPDWITPDIAVAHLLPVQAFPVPPLWAS